MVAMDKNTEDLQEIPPVEVNMVIDDTPIVLEDDETAIKEKMENYEREMLAAGLTTCDVAYFIRAYRSLEDVKYIRIHCTSCDKHIGSAPKDMSSRCMHPILKVLLCLECFVFYTSGDFTKDEDGSELYCRWCGEGGQVFCCTQCPFVFCKSCIRRNLGRGIARDIQDSDNWLCFACSPLQISRHRATYWAIQKYSEEMMERYRNSIDKSPLALDENICCSSSKRRADVYNKLKESVMKRPRLGAIAPVLQKALNSPTKKEKERPVKKKWPGTLPPSQSSVAEVQHDEVICTPDIIPIDDSPPSSPKLEMGPLEPATMSVQAPLISGQIPGQISEVPEIQAQIHPLRVRPLLQRELPLLSPLSVSPGLPSYPQKIVLRHHSPVLLQRFPQKSPAEFVARPNSSLGNSVLLNPSPSNSAAGNSARLNPSLGNSPLLTSCLRNSAVCNSPLGNSALVNPSRGNSAVGNSSLVVNSAVPAKSNDWFDVAVIHCSEVTEYISTKISSLSGVHSRAHKSERLMEELHNTLQTYLYVAVEKLQKIKKTLRENFEKETHRTSDPEKVVNPFSVKVKTTDEDTGTHKGPTDVGRTQETTTENELEEDNRSGTDKADDAKSPNESEESSASEESDSSCGSSRKRTRRIISSSNIRPEDVLFDMDVTNASDEEAAESDKEELKQTEISDSKSKDTKIEDRKTSDSRFAENESEKGEGDLATSTEEKSGAEGGRNGGEAFRKPKNPGEVAEANGPPEKAAKETKEKEGRECDMDVEIIPIEEPPSEVIDISDSGDEADEAHQVDEEKKSAEVEKKPAEAKKVPKAEKAHEEIPVVHKKTSGFKIRKVVNVLLKNEEYKLNIQTLPEEELNKFLSSAVLLKKGNDAKARRSTEILGGNKDDNDKKIRRIKADGSEGPSKNINAETLRKLAKNSEGNKKGENAEALRKLNSEGNNEDGNVEASRKSTASSRESTKDSEAFNETNFESSKTSVMNEDKSTATKEEESPGGEVCDLEEILSSNVVMRSLKPCKTTFGDEFSKFIDRSDPENSELSSDRPESVDEKEQKREQSSKLIRVEKFSPDISGETEMFRGFDPSEINQLKVYKLKKICEQGPQTASSIKPGLKKSDTLSGTDKKSPTSSSSLKSVEDSADEKPIVETPRKKNLGKEKVPEMEKKSDSVPVLTDSNSEDSLKSKINIARELDIIPEYVNDIYSKDNGSLSLPPDNISEFSSTKNFLFNINDNAENCVSSPVDICKNSAECKG